MTKRHLRDELLQRHFTPEIEYDKKTHAICFIGNAIFFLINFALLISLEVL
tara:strand:- start:173 stop:325 length:153 start_codon:yes stop_codon:yes gene_type:complete